MSGLARTSSYRKANATAEAEATETGALLHRPDQGVRSLLECAACDPLASPGGLFNPNISTTFYHPSVLL